MPVAKTDRTHGGARAVQPIEGMRLAGTCSIAQLPAHALALPVGSPAHTMLLLIQPLLQPLRWIARMNSVQCEMVDTGNSVPFLSSEAFDSSCCCWQATWMSPSTWRRPACARRRACWRRASRRTRRQVKTACAAPTYPASSCRVPVLAVQAPLLMEPCEILMERWRWCLIT